MAIYAFYGMSVVEGMTRYNAGLAQDQAEEIRQFDLGLERKYGITLEQYNAMGEAQGWACALCGEPETRLATGKNVNGVTIQRLSVDHDHSCCPGNYRACGKCLRGLFCAHCNWLTGRLEGLRGRLVVANLPVYPNRRPLAAGVGAEHASASPAEEV